MPININNAHIVQTCGQRIAALSKYVTTKSAEMVTFDGQALKLSDVLAVYQDCIDSRAELITQRAQFDAALATRDSAETKRQAIDKKLRSWVDAKYGVESPVAQEFGFLPPKLASKSAATKAKAVELMLATREARQTLGKRQKAGIKGTLTAPTAPAAPAVTAPAAPAAGAPASTNGTLSSAPASNGVSLSN